jgi:hypothetical protein
LSNFLAVSHSRHLVRSPDTDETIPAVCQAPCGKFTH